MRATSVPAAANLVLLVCLLIAAPAAAKTTTGIDLARACRAAEGAPAAQCAGFIEGFTFGSQETARNRFFDRWNYAGKTWCAPREAAVVDIKQVFLDYAGRNTGELHFPAALVLSNALAAAYPCERQ